jgi:uroporphyrinogen-III synthase
MVRDRRCEGLKFKRQHPVGDFIVDLYCPELKLVIELDGSIHADPDQAAKDEIRTSGLESLGLTVVRLKNHEVSLLAFQRIISSLKSPPSPRDSVERGSGGEAEPIIFPP